MENLLASAFGSVFKARQRPSPTAERREEDDREVMLIHINQPAREQESRDDRQDLVKELERRLRQDLLRNEDLQRWTCMQEEEGERRELLVCSSKASKVGLNSTDLSAKWAADTALDCTGLCCAEQEERSALEEAQQAGLETMCSWMDGVLDQDELLILQSQESDARSLVIREAEWGSDLLALATALQHVAHGEHRMVLVRAEMRARAALWAAEAAHRGTYERVLQRWAVENAERDARKAIFVDCDCSYLDVLRAGEVALEFQRLRILEKEVKARQALLRAEFKERSTIESRASTELTARHVWWFKAGELQAREVLQKAQMLAWASLRQRSDQEHRLVLLVEAEMQRRLSLLQEPAHFWQRVDAQVAMDAQQQQSCIQASFEAAHALMDQEDTEWRWMGDAFASEWAYLCSSLFHLTLQAEWDSRDAIEDEEDDAFDELLSAMQGAQMIAEQRTLLRVEADLRRTTVDAEQSIRCDLLLDFNDIPQPPPRAQTPSLIHLGLPKAPVSSAAQWDPMAVSSPTSSADSSVGCCLSSVASSPSGAPAPFSPAASDDLPPWLSAPLRIGRGPGLLPLQNAGFNIPSPAKPTASARKAGKAPLKVPVGSKAGHRQRLTAICEGLLDTMAEVLQADRPVVPRLPPIAQRSAFPTKQQVVCKWRQLQPFSAVQEEEGLRLPPLSTASSAMTPVYTAIPTF